jgi:hypothetical protein
MLLQQSKQKMNYPKRLSLQRSTSTYARAPHILNNLQKPISNEMPALTEDEIQFLVTYFKDYEQYLKDWVIQEFEKDKLLNSKTGVKKFKMLSMPELLINDTILLKNEKLNISKIINLKEKNKTDLKYSPEDDDIIKDLKILTDDEIIFRAKMEIYMKWQTLVNRIIIRSK